MSDKPYEFTWDGLNFPAIPPGGMADYPEEIARHAIRKSEIHDETGMPIGYKVQLFQAATQAERERLNKILVFNCPFAEIDNCRVPPMSREELTEHMAKHRASRSGPQKNQ